MSLLLISYRNFHLSGTVTCPLERASLFLARRGSPDVITVSLSPEAAHRTQEGEGPSQSPSLPGAQPRGSCSPSAASQKHRFLTQVQEQRPVSRCHRTMHLAIGFQVTSGFRVEGKRKEVGISGTQVQILQLFLATEHPGPALILGGLSCLPCKAGTAVPYSIVRGLPWESTWHGPCTGRHGSLPLLHIGRSNPR